VKNKESDKTEKVSSQGNVPLNRALYKDAMGLYRTKQYAQAGILFDKLLNSTDNVSLQSKLIKFYHSQSWRKHAEQMINQGNYTSAAQALQKSLKSIPCSTGLITFLADSILGQKKQENNSFDALGDSQAANMFKQAASYYLSGKVEDAIEIIRDNLIPSYPSNFEINYYLGIILAAQDRPNEAIKYLTKAVRLRPENLDAHWKLGLAHASTGHLPEALYHLQQAHNIDPANNWILAHLILSAQQAERFGIRANIKVNPIDDYECAAENYALDELAHLIMDEPEFVTAFLELPQTNIDEEIFSAVLRIILRALEYHPEYADLHYHCSCVYQRLGKVENAIDQSKEALQINSRYINATIHLAKLYSQTNQNTQAIDRLQAAIANGANYADVHYMLGDLYRREGRIIQAREHYQQALQINENYAPAKQALQSLSA